MSALKKSKNFCKMLIFFLAISTAFTAIPILADIGDVLNIMSEDFVYAEDVGILPNGKDCTEKLNEILEDGKSVYFGNGTYSFYGTVKLKNAHLYGTGDTTLMQHSGKTFIEADGCFGISNVYLSFSSITGSERAGQKVAIELGKNGGVTDGSFITKVGMGECGTALYEAEDATPTKGLSIQTMEIFQTSYACFDFYSYGRLNNKYSNIYTCQMSRKNTYAVKGFYFGGSERNLKIDQINVEHYRAINSVIFSGVEDLDVSTIHIEGMDIPTANEGYLKFINTSGKIDSISYYWTRLSYENCSGIVLGDADEDGSNIKIGAIHFKGINDPNGMHGDWPIRGISTKKFKIFDRYATSKNEYKVTLECYIPFTWQNDWNIFEAFPCSENITFLKKGEISTSGTTEQRPIHRLCKGYSRYFDTSLGKDLIYDGAEWVEMDIYNAVDFGERIFAESDDFVAEFDYCANKNADETLTIGLNSQALIKKYENNFNNFSTGDIIRSPYNSNEATITDGMLSIGQWRGNAFSVFEGDDYEATFTIKPQHHEYGKCHIRLKDNLYLHLVGSAYSGYGSNNTISLYQGIETVDYMPGNDKLLASADIYEKIGLSAFSDEINLRVKIKDNTVYLYCNVANDLQNGILLFKVKLSEEFKTTVSKLEFSQGNTGLYIDDVTVYDISNGRLFLDGESGGEIIHHQDFEQKIDTSKYAEIIELEPNNPALHLYYARGKTTPFLENVKGNYILNCWLKTSNYDWDWVDIELRGDCRLELRGKYNSYGKETYEAALYKGSTELSRMEFEGEFNPVNGVFLKVEVFANEIKVHFSTRKDFSNEKNLEASCDVGTVGNISIYRYDSTIVIDDLSVISQSGYKYFKSNFSEYAAFDEKESIIDFEGNKVLALTNSKVVNLSVLPSEFDLRLKLNATTNGSLCFGKYKIQIEKKENRLNTSVYYNEILKETVPYAEYCDDTTGNLYVKILVHKGSIAVYFNSNEDFSGAIPVYGEYTNDFNGDSIFYALSSSQNTYGSTFYLDDFKILNPIVSNETYSEIKLNGNTITVCKIFEGKERVISSYGGLELGKKYKVKVERINGVFQIYIDERLITNLWFLEPSTEMVYENIESDISISNSQKEFIIFDCNLDGEVNGLDLVTLRRILLIDTVNEFNGDVNNDGKTNIIDLIVLKKYLIFSI